MNGQRWIEDVMGNPGFQLPPESVVLGLVLAFILGQVLAWVYYATHSGLSYSKSFVQSLVLIAVVVAMVMTAIGDNLIMALGLMGALAMIRFRNMIKDTRDIAFISAALVIGMACGAQRFFTSIVGTGLLTLIALYLYWVDFGAHQPKNGFLRFQIRGDMGPDHAVQGILKRYCRRVVLVSVQADSAGSASHYAYQVTLANSADNAELVQQLEDVDGLSHLQLTLQEQLLEV